MQQPTVGHLAIEHAGSGAVVVIGSGHDLVVVEMDYRYAPLDQQT